jgi:hypothetical protein
MAFTTFGIGAPINPAQALSWGTPPYGVSVNPYLAQQPYGQPMNVPLSPFAPTPSFGVSPLHQVFQLLQIVPQQLQQLQQSIIVQQQQLQQIQQLLQLIPGHLAQLQQVIQPQQIQQPSSPQFPGLTGFGAAVPWGIAPQVFAQPGHVM